MLDKINLTDKEINDNCEVLNCEHTRKRTNPEDIPLVSKIENSTENIVRNSVPTQSDKVSHTGSEYTSENVNDWKLVTKKKKGK